MKIQTQRLQINPMEPRDRENLLALLTDETVAKTYMLPQFRTKEEAEPLCSRLMEQSQIEDRYLSGVCLNGQLIGMIHMVDRKDEKIEVGYAYLPAYHNCGYGTEALAAVISYLLGHGFETVLAGAFTDNPVSIRIMEKCGMTRLPETEQIEYRGNIRTCFYYGINCSHQK